MTGAGRHGMGADSVAMEMLLRELWNEGEVSIPPLHKLELFTGLNAFSIPVQQLPVVNFICIPVAQ